MARPPFVNGDEDLTAGSTGLAVPVVPESFGPAERTAFALHDVSGPPFEEVGRTAALRGRQFAGVAGLSVAG